MSRLTSRAEKLLKTKHLINRLLRTKAETFFNRFQRAQQTTPMACAKSKFQQNGKSVTAQPLPNAVK